MSRRHAAAPTGSCSVFRARRPAPPGTRSCVVCQFVASLRASGSRFFDFVHDSLVDLREDGRRAVSFSDLALDLRCSERLVEDELSGVDGDELGFYVDDFDHMVVERDPFVRP